MQSRKVFIAIITLVIMLAFRLYTYHQNIKDYQEGEMLSLVSRLAMEPEVKFARKQFYITDNNGRKIKITTGLNKEYKYGDLIQIKGKVKINLFKGRKFYSIDYPLLQIVKNDHNFIARFASQIRRFSNELYRKSLNPNSAGLLSGIVFGGDQGLSQSLMTNLRNSGVIHVIAASGMNVTFVASALIGVLGVLLRRQIAITIAILGVLFYAFISGFEPSIVRASIMSVLAFSASLLGRQNFALGSVFVTGYIMLFFAPTLITSVGFQLSFAATLGILLIKPLFPVFKSFPLLDDIWTTVAAQIATLPILLAIFGNYGILSILVNALVLWTVPILMVLGSIGLLLGFVFEPLGRIFLLLSEPVLFFFVKVVEYFGSFGLNLVISEVSIFVWVGYYFILSAFIIAVKIREM